MNRKEWFQFSTVALATLLVADKLWAKNTSKQLLYLMAELRSAPQLSQGDHTFPFDWAVSEIKPNGSSVSLSWEDKLQGNGNAYFRLTSATDIREECIIELSLANTKKIIGQQSPNCWFL